MDRPGVIYKVCPAAHWEACVRVGVLPWSEADVRDGFVHLSCAHQLDETLRRHYRDAPDPWLLEVQTRALPAGALRWEISRGGEAFPHLYADLPRAAIARAHALVRGADGVVLLPEGLLQTTSTDRDAP
jgi:uncharacterized protein (DUF952 family)